MNKTVFKPSTIKTIDAAILDYFKAQHLSVDTNKGFVEVPVYWAGSERSFQIKHSQSIRDKDGSLILPQMALSRTSMEKSLDSNKRGKYTAVVFPNGDVKGGSIQWTKRIEKKQTSAFARDTSIRKSGQINFSATKKPKDDTVYETITIPVPIYFWIGYELTIKTEYMMQLNDIIQGMQSEVGGAKYFIAEKDGWRYECFYDENFGIETNAEDFGEDERYFKSKTKFNVLGYIIGGGKNESQPTRVVRENAVRVQISEEII